MEECLACGTPVVVADIPQLRERLADLPAVRHAEAQAQPVADALAAFLEEPVSERSRSSARAWAVANADYRPQRRRLGDVYDGLLGLVAPL